MRLLPAGARNRVVILLTAAFFARGLLLILSLPFGDPLDELFHSGYAEYVTSKAKIPGSATESMPLENIRLSATLPRATSWAGPRLSFREFMAMPRARQQAIRNEAFTAVPRERSMFLGPNYETQQPPLMYILGGLVLRLAPSPINVRLFLLRLLAILCATSGVPLAWLFFRRLLPRRAALAATWAFVGFPGPTTFTSRFTNDALAFPLAIAAAILLADIGRGRLSVRKAALLAGILVLGSWTKIYFLTFFPAAIVAALIAPKRDRMITLSRAAIAVVLAFALFTPWMVWQHRDSGDWFGLTETKAATKAGVGWLARVALIPHLVNVRLPEVLWKTFSYPGTWADISGPTATAIVTLAGFLMLVIGPQLARRSPSRMRMRAWWGAAGALLFFGVGQLAHLTTFAVVGIVGGAEGWYALVLLPVVLAAGVAFGKHVPPALFVAAAALFVIGDLIGLGNLAAIYGGAALRPLRVFSRVGLFETPPLLLAAIGVVWLSADAWAAALILRRGPSRASQPSEG